MNELTMLMLAEENADDDYAEEKVSEDVPDSDFDVRGASEQKSDRDLASTDPISFNHPISIWRPLPPCRRKKTMTTMMRVAMTMWTNDPGELPCCMQGMPCCPDNLWRTSK